MVRESTRTHHRYRRNISRVPLVVFSLACTLLLGCLGTTSSTFDPERNQGKKGTGNALPPSTALCIDVEPQTALVTVGGKALPESGCVDVYQSMIKVEAKAEGYQEYSDNIQLLYSTNPIKHAIQMKKSVKKEVVPELNEKKP